MSGVGFLIPLLFGAAVLAVEAHRLFYDPTLKKVISRGRFPILEGVELDDLSPPRVQTLGYLFYIGIYLIVFGLAVSLTEFGDYLYKASQSNQEFGGQGAIPTKSNEIPFLSDSGNGRPLAIALAIIALMSARGHAGETVRALEGTVRNFAHRLAGIPHSIYRLITRLNNVEYQQVMSENESAHWQLFEKIRKRMAVGSAIPKVLQRRIDDASDDLRAIDVLIPPVLGDKAFPVAVTEALAKVIENQSLECKALTDQMEIAALESSPKITNDEMYELIDKIQKCLRNLKAVFSVLYSQNEKNTINAPHPSTRFVVEFLRQPDLFRLKDKALLSVFVVSVIYVVICFFSEVMYQNYKAGLDVLGLESIKSIDSVQKIIVSVIYLVMTAIFLFSFAFLVTVSIRRAALDEEKWRDYTLNNLPTVRLLKTAIWPAIISATAVLVVTIVLDMILSVYSNEWTLPSAKVFVSSIESNSKFVPLHVLLGMIVSVVTLLVADQHLKLPAWKTITLAISFTIPFLLFSVLGHVMTTPDSGALQASFGHESIWLVNALKSAGLLSSYALMAFCGFAWLVERSENKGGDAC